MHKKLAADLTSLAHSILQMKNKEDVVALKAKAHAVYEKLALLVYVEEYINNTPNATVTKEEIISKIATIETEVIVTDTIIETEELTNTSIDVNLTKDTVTDENSFNEAFLTENKDRDEISFTIVEPIEEPFVQERLFAEPEVTPTKDSFENQKIEQPFDELENILFGDAPVKDEASFIEELKTSTTETEEIITKDNEIIGEELLIEEEVTTIIENTQPHQTASEETSPIEEETIPNTEDIKPQITLEETIVNQEEEEPTFTKESKTLTLEDELADTLSVDVMANLFEKAPVKKTLNDRLLQNSIKIDLNDRIAFVKNLFEGNQEDFNRVISQLNTIKTERGAKQFILKMVKPDYDWSTKEAYEARLLEIIERRFS